MTLKSFGCSFIFGSELADDGRNGPYATPSQYTWPAHVARHINQSYECYARPGAGNLQILEQVLNQVGVSCDQDLFVIGWTWIDRFDYYTSDHPGQRTPWSTIMPIDQTKLAQTYYRELHSEYRDKLTNLIYIKLAIDLLTQKKIPYIMTYMDKLLFDQRWHITPAVTDLQAHVQPHMTEFAGKSFLDWSRNHSYPVSEQWHPLEQAHDAAGKYIINQCFAQLS